MSKIIWDKAGERFYETGVDHGVLYVANGDTYKPGVAWNGLTSVSESPSGAESNPQYADNIKYVDLISAEEFGATIEAFTYPPEFEPCNGAATPSKGVTIGQQRRVPFAFSYRTLIGNDTESTDAGYKLHIVYGCQAAPSEKAYNTINDSPEAITFSWEITTTPVPVEGYKPSATVTINSREVDPAVLKQIEDKLYGTDAEEPTLLMPGEIFELVGAATAEPSTGA